LVPVDPSILLYPLTVEPTKRKEEPKAIGKGPGKPSADKDSKTIKPGTSKD
jgi:hypothetical protein